MANKSDTQVKREFKQYVNMTADELEEWLKSDQSNSAGWTRSDSKKGETVGHESGRIIVEILRTKGSYSEDQVAHMRKVVSYCKRHLAQETSSAESKSAEEVKKTKSYASLKNWGHDILRALNKSDDDDAGNEEVNEQVTQNEAQGEEGEYVGGSEKETQPKTRGRKRQHQDDAYEEDIEGEEKEEEKDDDGSDAKKYGKEDAKKGAKKGSTKTSNDTQLRRHGRPRKAKKISNEDQEQANSEGNDAAMDYEMDVDEVEDDHDKNNTSKGNGKTRTRAQIKKQGGNKEEEEEEDEQEVNDDDGNDDTNEDSAKNSQGPKKGDTVSWKWGGGNPQGKVLDVKPEDASITTKKGNTVTRKGTSDDPAVILDAGKSKAIKKAHELN